MALYTVVIDGDLIEGATLHRGTLHAGRHSFDLFEDEEAADKAAQERWLEMDGDELVALVGVENVVSSWRRGESLVEWIEENVSAEGEYGGSSQDVDDIVEYLKNEYPHLSDWIEELVAAYTDYTGLSDVLDTDEDFEVTDDDEDAEDKETIAEALEGWQELIDELGFTPAIAYYQH